MTATIRVLTEIPLDWDLGNPVQLHPSHDGIRQVIEADDGQVVFVPVYSDSFTSPLSVVVLMDGKGGQDVAMLGSDGTPVACVTEDALTTWAEALHDEWHVKGPHFAWPDYCSKCTA